MFRLEFGVYDKSPQQDSTSDEKTTPQLIPAHGLFMPMPGFIRSLRGMQEVMKHLEQRKQQNQNQQPAPQLQGEEPFVATALPRKPPSNGG